MSFESRAEDWLKWVVERAESGCAWCKHPKKKVVRRNLGSHCYRTHLEAERLEKTLATAKEKHGSKLGHEFDTLQLDYRTAVQMTKSAKIEGSKYMRLYAAEATPLELEFEFGQLSERYFHADLFRQDAHLFECLSPVNRRYVMYLISFLTREHARRLRRVLSRDVAFQEEIEEFEASQREQRSLRGPESSIPKVR